MNWYTTYKVASEILTEEKITQMAEYCINYIWNNKKTAHLFSDDPDSKYSAYNIILMIDNEQPLNSLMWKYGEENYEKIRQRISEILEQKENEMFQRKQKRTPQDPLDYLRKAIKGKSWEKAKEIILRLTPAGLHLSKGWQIEDESAEKHFDRLYNVIFSGTYVNVDNIREDSPFQDNERKRIIKRLGEIKNWNIHSGSRNNNELENKYIETELFNALFGFKLIDAPEKIKVYRGTSNPNSKIRPGDYVTPNRDYARNYKRGKYGVIIQDVLPTQDLIISKMNLGYENVELIYFPVSFQKEVEEKGVEHFTKTPPFTFREFYEQVNKANKVNI